MKFVLKVIFLFLPILLTTLNIYGQSGSFIIGIDHFQKTNGFFHYLLSDKSLGLKLGYSKDFDNDAWSADIIGFGNYLDYNNFDIGKDKYFTGGTLFTGIGLMPRYCFNPDQKFRLFIGVLGNVQYAFGQGDVFKKSSGDTNQSDEILERKFIKAGFGFSVSPQLIFEYPVELGTVGIEAGWNSSDAGKGINALRSSFYKQINYHSSSFFIGFVLKISS